MNQCLREAQRWPDPGLLYQHHRSPGASRNVDTQARAAEGVFVLVHARSAACDLARAGGGAAGAQDGAERPRCTVGVPVPVNDGSQKRAIWATGPQGCSGGGWTVSVDRTACDSVNNRPSPNSELATGSSQRCLRRDRD